MRTFRQVLEVFLRVIWMSWHILFQLFNLREWFFDERLILFFLFKVLSEYPDRVEVVSWQIDPQFEPVIRVRNDDLVV